MVHDRHHDDEENESTHAPDHYIEDIVDALAGGRGRGIRGNGRTRHCAVASARASNGHLRSVKVSNLFGYLRET